MIQPPESCLTYKELTPDNLRCHLKFCPSSSRPRLNVIACQPVMCKILHFHLHPNFSWLTSSTHFLLHVILASPTSPCLHLSRCTAPLPCHLLTPSPLHSPTSILLPVFPLYPLLSSLPRISSFLSFSLPFLNSSLVFSTCFLSLIHLTSACVRTCPSSQHLYSHYFVPHFPFLLLLPLTEPITFSTPCVSLSTSTHTHIHTNAFHFLLSLHAVSLSSCS